MINRSLPITMILLLYACIAYPKEITSMTRVDKIRSLMKDTISVENASGKSKVYIKEGFEDEGIVKGGEETIEVDIEDGVDGGTEVNVEEGVNEVVEVGVKGAVEENVEEDEEQGVEEGRGRRVKRYTGTGTGSLKWILSPFPEWFQWWVYTALLLAALVSLLACCCGCDMGTAWMATCCCLLPCLWPFACLAYCLQTERCILCNNKYRLFSKESHLSSCEASHQSEILEMKDSELYTCKDCQKPLKIWPEDKVDKFTCIVCKWVKELPDDPDDPDDEVKKPAQAEYVNSSALRRPAEGSSQMHVCFRCTHAPPSPDDEPWLCLNHRDPLSSGLTEINMANLSRFDENEPVGYFPGVQVVETQEPTSSSGLLSRFWSTEETVDPPGSSSKTSSSPPPGNGRLWAGARTKMAARAALLNKPRAMVSQAMPGAVMDRHRNNVRGLSSWISRDPPPPPPPYADAMSGSQV